MSLAKVMELSELDKLKAEKRLTAKVCCVQGCGRIGNWHNKDRNFYLANGMCFMHYTRDNKHGDPNIVLRIQGENRTKNIHYGIYNAIKTRTTNPNSQAYKDYGGRGITMSDEWLNDFNAFCRDMGERPSKSHTVERRKNNEGYSKENCYWAKRHEQAANRRSNNKTVGVSFHKDRDKWAARIEVEGKKMQKRFNTEQEAIAQRKAWEQEFKIYSN